MIQQEHTTPHNPHELPPNLPVPTDDGACDHLRGARIAPLQLPDTTDQLQSLTEIASGPAVLFFYPRTGIPGQPPTLGFRGEEWDSIPGARGCTPQSCGFRDLYSQFADLGVRVFGVSTNTTAHQSEFKQRTHIPFEFLSDSELWLTKSMALPTFEFPDTGGPTTMIQRMAWYLNRGIIEHLWYPVFPPNENASRVLSWLRTHPGTEPVRIREKSASDADYIAAELHKHWRNNHIWSLGNIFDASALPAFIATHGQRQIGLLTYAMHNNGAEMEVITLSANSESRGVGTKLLSAAADLAKSKGCRRIFLTTTNDNLRAIGFYQKRGWTMARYHNGSMDRARLAKPGIPLIGMHNIPLKDELEFELILTPHGGTRD